MEEKERVRLRLMPQHSQVDELEIGSGIDLLPVDNFRRAGGLCRLRWVGTQARGSGREERGRCIERGFCRQHLPTQLVD